MTKSKKSRIIICTAIGILIAVICALAYVFFGIIGTDSKRVYSQSEIVNNNVNTGVTVLDDTTAYQSMNGFGASACWWSKSVGSWENSEEILSYLYDDKNGIGLNIYRYNLGAGSTDDEHITRERNRAECFLNPDGSYDFSADRSAQNALAAAKKIAGDDLRVTLFCNSPPVSLTKNGVSYASPQRDENAPWISNLDESNYNAFADFCYNSAEYFLKQGYRVTDVSPINEPQYDWRATYNDDGTYSAKQEGCYYSKYQAAELYKSMINKFAGSEVEGFGCKVSMFESGSAEGKGSSSAAYLDCIIGKGPKYASKNKILRDYFDSVSFHSYWSSTKSKQKAADYLAKKYSSYDVVCTEYCQMKRDENSGVFDLISKEKNGTSGLSIEYGVAMAKIIVDDLTILNAKEWDWWTACSDDTYTDGLVYINPENHDDIKLSKRLWCLGNFSRFIEEGASRIACSSGVDSLASCAFVNPDNSTVVVYVNNTDKDETTALTSTGDYSVYTTSSKYDLEKTASGKTGDIAVKVPAMSVVTVVFN